MAGMAAHKVARNGMVRTFQLTKSLARLSVMENMKLGATGQRGEGFGRALLPPLWIFSFTPVEEVQRVHGQMQRFEADAADVRARLLRYPTQPDFAVDTRGLIPTNLPYALDLEYEEGIFASEKDREPVLVSGFIQRLAAATVVLVEGRR